jgi:glucan phosphoethanolaminetransferase (alkaline phosphatase superfamily)
MPAGLWSLLTAAILSIRHVRINGQHSRVGSGVDSSDCALGRVLWTVPPPSATAKSIAPVSVRAYNIAQNLELTSKELKSVSIKSANPETVIQPNRREFLQSSLAVAGSILTSPVSMQAKDTASSKKRPNLVFFLGEGQRADAMSVAGHPILKTPNHDRIANEGMRFTNAFCTNSICAPARAVALTGMYSKSTGALANED